MTSSSRSSPRDDGGLDAIVDEPESQAACGLKSRACAEPEPSTGPRVGRDARSAVREIAYSYLGPRERTVVEVRDRLARSGFDAELRSMR